MENFTAYNPTKLHFGQKVVEKLPEEIAQLGPNVLLMTGKGSVKKYGYYDQVVDALKQSGKNIIEFSGIKPNPIVDDAERALALAKKEKIDFIVALGGGSVIDTAKMVNMGYANGQPIWPIMKREVNPTKKVPLFALLTLAATGTEMNGAAVLQNHQTEEKIGYFSPLMYPDVSFLDPSWTLTVPKDQTINGIVDLVSHSLEAYFSGGKAPLSDRFVASVINETMSYAPELLNNLSDYDLRARMMWSATVAENGTTMHGRQTTGDWGTHALAHHISLLWDTPHGQTLSIIFPAWMKALSYKIGDRLENLGYLLTGKKTLADDTIKIIEDFFNSIGAPTRFEQLGFNDNDKEALLKLWHKNKPRGMNIDITNDDYQQILEKI
jgi:alcohol dehydrogenase YqhD (iron-dependent ADH family)